MPAPLLSPEEVTARLAAEGITLHEFVRQLFADGGYYPTVPRLAWLGPVAVVSHEHRPASAQELENEVVVFHLPAHGLYLRTHGTNEPMADNSKGPKQWCYEALRPCKPVSETSTTTSYV